MLARTPEGEPRYKLRRRLLHYALFAGCLTGRRLKLAFDSLVGEIVWDEASPEIGGCHSSVFPADPAHIKSILEAEQPDIVLAFGGIAIPALRELKPKILLEGPHPAARQSDVMARLQSMAANLRGLLASH